MPITSWTPETSQALVSLVITGDHAFTDIAAKLNAEFGTSYSKNSAIGKARRLGLCKERSFGSSVEAIERRRERERERKRLARQKGWGTSYTRHESFATRKGTRKMMLAGGASKTSPAYRKHLPPAPEMTKTELRAMLATAVQNTAAMVMA